MSMKKVSHPGLILRSLKGRAFTDRLRGGYLVSDNTGTIENHRAALLQQHLSSRLERDYIHDFDHVIAGNTWIHHVIDYPMQQSTLAGYLLSMRLTGMWPVTWEMLGNRCPDFLTQRQLVPTMASNFGN